MNDAFVSWLVAELEDRGWSQRQFAAVIEAGLVPAGTVAVELQRAGVRVWVEGGEVTRIEP